MKHIKSSQGIVTILLFILLLISISFIIHLEIKAANLASKWDEHEKSLLKNEDVLDKLVHFSRSVKGSNIDLFSSDLTIQLEKSHSALYMSEKGLNLTSAKDLIIYLQPGSEFALTKSGVKLKVDGNLKIGPSKYIDDASTPIYISYNEGKFDIVNSASHISVGPHNIHLFSGPASINMDWGHDEFSLSYNSDKSFIKFLGDSININTKGNINITSTNGNVNIRGKKVRMNE